MANSLLDFVMSLVRDPDAAARFAENPDQAILDANLTNVTSADVSNLIPVVTESLGGNVPTVDGQGIVDIADNVWASDSVTTGIRLLTSALVTLVRLASTMAWSGFSAKRAAASGSRTRDITKSSSELAMKHPPSL